MQKIQYEPGGFFTSLPLPNIPSNNILNTPFYDFNDEGADPNYTPYPGSQLTPEQIQSNNQNLFGDEYYKKYPDDPSNPANKRKGLNLPTYNDVSNSITGMNFLSNYLLSQKEQNRNEQNSDSFFRSINNPKPINEQSTRYGRNSANGSQYTGIITAEEGAHIRNSLNIPTPVEIENGEVLLLPDGTFEIAKGKTHEKGGINTILPEGTFIFSNDLKPNGGKRTFAQEARKHDYTRELTILNDPTAKKIDTDTAKIMLERKTKKLKALAEEQQSLNNNSIGQAVFSRGGFINGSHKDGWVVKYDKGGPVSKEKFKTILNNPELEDSIISTMYQEYLKAPDTYFKDYGDTPQDGTINTHSLKEIQAMEKNPTYDDTPDTLPKKRAKLQSIISEIKRRDNVDFGQDVDFTKADQKTLDVVAGNMQEWLKAQSPDTVKSYMKFVDPTNLGKLNPNDPYKGFEDKRWWYRAPQYKDVEFDTQEQMDQYISGKQGLDYTGKKYYQDDINTDYFINPILKKLDTAPGDPNAVKGVQSPTAPSIASTVTTTKKDPYVEQAYPLLNKIGDTLPYLNSINTFPYQTPDYTHWEVNPAKQDIQSNLNDITASTNSFKNSSTGNPALKSSRNSGIFASMLAAKNQVYQNKQNYDAQAQYTADVFNAEGRTKEQTLDTNAWTNTYNELFASAQDNAATERSRAISHAINNQQKHYSNEASKSLYLNSFFPNVTSKDGKNINFDPSDAAFLMPHLFGK